MNYRVSNINAGLVIGIAFVGDCLQFLLEFTGVGVIADTFIAVVFEGPIYLWLMLLGVSFMDGKKSGLKLASLIGSTVIELVPFLDALPGLTFGVIGVIYASRKEDKENFKAQQQQQSQQAIAVAQEQGRKQEAYERFAAMREQ